MSHGRPAVYFMLLLVSGVGGSVRGDDRAVEQLIDQSADISEPGFGYSAYFSGGEFLPYQNAEQVNTLILGAARPIRSEALAKVVEQGAAAVPMLLKHMGDNRPCKMKPVSGFMWMRFAEEYDFNRRTAEKAPEGVNRDEWRIADDQPNEHAVTVGDLCFVAIGQIVNRSFSAVRYQPSGGMVVNSPTHSPLLGKAILAEWSGLTKERHRERLIEDFVKADHEYRRNGAYLRLSFYYPDTVESLVLEELAKPTYDVFAAEKLCREVLYKTADKDERRRKYDEFVREHGEISAAGVMEQLFNDLDRLEGHESGASSPPLTEFGEQPRQLLVQLFGKPATVKSEDRPIVKPTSESERARFIGTLKHDRSPKVAEKVAQLFLKSADDEYFASACLLCLANRGQTEFLFEQLDKVKLVTADTDSVHLKYIEAIATSKNQRILDQLWEMAQKTTNVNYFMAILPTVDRKHDGEVLNLSRKLIAALPEDTKDGQWLLAMIGDRFPNDAPAIYKSFLRPGSAQRIETMCRVLWNGKPLATRILAPYLDDKRELSGFSIPMRVCDRAAQAISHATDQQIKFDSEWGLEQKEAQIERLKRYCRER